jgi:hypothetical protein
MCPRYYLTILSRRFSHFSAASLIAAAIVTSLIDRNNAALSLITQAAQMLIDQAIVPSGIASQQQVDQLNAVHARLTARMVDQITIPEPGSGFRASTLIRVYLQAKCARLSESTRYVGRFYNAL